MGSTLEVVVTGSVDQLEKALARGVRSTSGFQKGLNVASVAAGGALLALGAAAKVGFDEFVQGEKVSAQTAAVLKSTGGAANVTAGQIDTLSGALMRKSGVDDEVIKSGANMLLTFTNVRNEAGKGNDVFNQATATILDMSVALGSDTSTAAIQLGKALNDPVKGVTALQKVGVTFTDQQKKQIKALVESGDVMGAQKIILAELGKEFGGSAAAAGQTFAGKVNIMKQSLSNLAGNIVGGVMPAFEMLVGILSGATGWMSRHQTATKILIGVVAGLSAAVIVTNAVLKVHGAATVIASAAKALFTTQTVVATGATTAQTGAQTGLNTALAANPIGIVIVAIAGLAAGLVIAYQKSETFRGIVKGAFDAVKTAADAVWRAVSTVVDWIGNLASNGAIRTVVSVIGGPFVIVASRVDDVRGAIDAVISAGRAVVNWSGWGTIGGIIGGAFSGALAAIRGVKKAIDAVISAARTAARAISSAFGGGKDASRTDIVNPSQRSSGGEAAFGATGAVVTRKTLSWIGEAGPEAVIPLSSTPGSSPLPFAGGGAVHNHFHFHGAVASREDVIEWVREGLIRTGRRVPGALGGLA